MTKSSGLGLFLLAVIVVIGAFIYFIVRGGADAVVVPIMAISLSTVLQFFFAQHLSNGAAAAAVEEHMAIQTAADHAAAAALAAPPAPSEPKV